MMFIPARAALFDGHRGPLPAEPRIQFPFDDLEPWIGSPLQGLLSIDDGLKDALWRGRDKDLSYDCIVVRRDVRGCHSSSGCQSGMPLTLFLQIEMLDHLFSVIEELPVFGMMIRVHKGEDYAVHVASVGTAEIDSV